MNAGNSEYMPVPDSAGTASQMITETPPAIIPPTAPWIVIRFQNSDSIIAGPNAAPRPAQA